MQLGVVGSKQEMCLLWAGVKGALMMIIFLPEYSEKYNKLVQTEHTLCGDKALLHCYRLCCITGYISTIDLKSLKYV